MAVYLWAMAAAVLMALPIELDVELNINRAPGARVRVNIAGITVEYIMALRHGEDGFVLEYKRANSSRSHTRTLAQMHESRPALDAAMPAIKAGARHIMRNVDARKLGVQARLGLGDAAASAMAAGIMCILAAGFCAVADTPPEIDVQPDYAHRTFVLRAQGMFCLRLGHIIGAGQFCKEAFRRWIGRTILPRLKA